MIYLCFFAAGPTTASTVKRKQQQLYTKVDCCCCCIRVITRNAGESTIIAKMTSTDNWNFDWEGRLRKLESSLGFLVLLVLGVLMVLWRLMDVYAAKVESHPTDKLYFGLTAEMVLRRSHSPYTCQQIWRQSHGITANQKLFPISPLHGDYVLNTNC